MRIQFLAMQIIVLFIVALPATAQSIEGLDFVELNPPQLTTDPEKIVITEFFSYQCPHCYSLEPVLEQWVRELPDDVAFERVPVSNGFRQWLPIARAFHALEATGELEAVHTSIFRAIHVDGEQLYDRSSIIEWLEGRGIDSDEFSEMYDSFFVNGALSRGEQKSMTHRVFSVPTLAVDGRYRVAIGDNGTAEHFERQLRGVSELIESIRTEKGL